MKLDTIATRKIVCDSDGHNCFYILKLKRNEDKTKFFLSSRKGLLDTPEDYGKEVFIPKRNPEFGSYKKAKEEFIKIIMEKTNESRSRERCYRLLESWEELIDDGMMVYLESNDEKIKEPHFIEVAAYNP